MEQEVWENIVHNVGWPVRDINHDNSKISCGNCDGCLREKYVTLSSQGVFL